MPTRCFVVPFPFKDDRHRQPGAMWKTPLSHPYGDGTRYGVVHADRLSPQFKASGRDYVLHVVLPDGSPWSPDFKASDSDVGWTVTGTPPRITVQPSVNAEGSYHGFLTDGVFTDDIEGRKGRHG
jgi:hypothetical protein